MKELQILKQTMSSREIAELSGKPHADLMKAIRSMEPAWEKINGGSFSLVNYRDAKGEFRPMYELDKKECLYVATKFNDEARARLILRWEELEVNRLDFSNPDTVLVLVQNWKSAEEEKKRLLASNELQKEVIKNNTPKVEYFEEVLQSESTYTTTQIAKELGMGAPTLNRKLNLLRVQYKQSGTWVLYEKYQDKGYTKTKTHHYEDNGVKKTTMLTVWTEKGRLFIHSLIKQGINEKLRSKNLQKHVF